MRGHVLRSSVWPSVPCPSINTYSTCITILLTWRWTSTLTLGQNLDFERLRLRLHTPDHRTCSGMAHICLRQGWHVELSKGSNFVTLYQISEKKMLERELRLFCTLYVKVSNRLHLSPQRRSRCTFRWESEIRKRSKKGRIEHLQYSICAV